MLTNEELREMHGEPCEHTETTTEEVDRYDGATFTITECRDCGAQI